MLEIEIVDQNGNHSHIINSNDYYESDILTRRSNFMASRAIAYFNDRGLGDGCFDTSTVIQLWYCENANDMYDAAKALEQISLAIYKSDPYITYKVEFKG